MTRVDNMKRVARVLCAVAGSGDRYTDEQAFSIESTLLSRKFTPTLIDSVPRMIKDAASMSRDDLELEIERAMKGNKFAAKDKRELVVDLLRLVAMTDFPREQCDAIYVAAKQFGYNEAEVQDIMDIVESERDSAQKDSKNGRSREGKDSSTSLTPKAA
jgi:predicted nucleic-acid-binding protein